MKITAIEVTPVAIPLARSFAVASGRVRHGTHVVVEIHTDEEVSGVGEGSAVSATDADTQASMADVIQNRIAPALIGMNPLQIQFVIERLDRALVGNHCAKAAIDLGLFDLIGKLLKVPVYQLLGGRYREVITTLETDISLDQPAAMVAAAKEAKARGVTAFEIKVGSDPELDVERVRRIREAVGPEAKLRIDVNEGYDRGRALKTLRTMEKYDLAYIEQPLPRWDIDGMAGLCAALDTPICADQSAYTPHDVYRLLKADAADLVCIKLARSGFYKSALIHAACQAADVRNTLGSMMPLGVGVAAIHHFAIAMPNVAVGIAGVHGRTREFFEDDIIVGTSAEADGSIRLSDGPGLGVELDREKMIKYTIR